MGENNLIELLGYFSLEVIIPQCQVQKMKSNELFSSTDIQLIVYFQLYETSVQKL